MTDKCFMGILSCKKYKNRRDSQQKNLHDCPFKYKYFIGDKSLEEPKISDNIVFLPCGDEYKDIPDKVKHMFSWIINNYPDISYIIKTDDDIKFNFKNILNYYTEHLLKESNDYIGNKAINKLQISNYKMNVLPLELRKLKLNIPYKSGGGYILSRKAVDYVLKDIDKYKTGYEDYTVGYILNKYRDIKSVIVENWKKKYFIW